MKVVLTAANGLVGDILLRHFAERGDQVVAIVRKPMSLRAAKIAIWDGTTLGPWAEEIDGSDVVINLAGRTVNCRYNARNLREMMDSRVESTRVVGEAISAAKNPPRLWLQASTATIYAHRFDASNDERSGVLGGTEAGAPPKWNASVAIAKRWEKTLEEIDAPTTRKVAMRSAMTMSAWTTGVFCVLCGLARKGLGGRLGTGRQYVSWVHEADFANAVQFLIDHEELAGAVNICSPNPLPQARFMRILRDAIGVKIALSASAWMVEVGAWLRGTESELVLKSRRVKPTRLLEAGFEFSFPEWSDAAQALRQSALPN